MRIVPVILSGGIGSRLWPISTTRLPKQLQPLVGTETMIQATALRLGGVPEAGDPIVVCGSEHVDEIVGQLDAVAVRPQVMIAEPVGRNTAPAVAAAALSCPEEDVVLVVLPSDHVIIDLPAFEHAVRIAAEAATAGHLVTFGVVPTRPETGYGYIEVHERRPYPDAALPVAAFVEKPSLETAAEFVGGGRHLWNSGMFAFSPPAVLSELADRAPAVLAGVRAAIDEAEASADRIRLGNSFSDVPPVSFDHAVMEHTDQAAVVPLHAGWSDVGSWSTLWEIGHSDEHGNVVRGDVVALDVHDSLIRADSRTVAAVGVRDLVIVETADAVLVMPRDRAQDVREVWTIVDSRSGR